MQALIATTPSLVNLQDNKSKTIGNPILVTNSKNIHAPQYFWKIIVDLQPGQSLSDITGSTPVIAVIMPNRDELVDRPEGRIVPLPNGVAPLTITQWNEWTQWQVSIADLETITGYNFFSNLPTDVQTQIEQKRTDRFIDRVFLLADNSLVSSEILPFQTGESVDFSVGQGDSDRAMILNIANPNFSSSEVSVSKASFIGQNVLKIGSSDGSSSKHSSTQIGSFERSIIQVAPIEANTIGTTIIKDSSPQVSILESSPIQISTLETGSFQVGIVEHNILEASLGQISTYQNNASQIQVVQSSTTPINSSEVSLSSPNQSLQLLSVHNSTCQLVSNFYSTAQTFWHNTTPFNLKIEIQDLPAGQLASATITGYDTFNRPNSGTLTLDINGNGLGWFIDTTPDDNSEFTTQLADTAYSATPDSAAYGKYDLITTILHELGHLNGIIKGNTAFDSYINSINGTPTFVDGNITAQLTPDGSHLNPTFHPYDLMNTSLKPGVRKLPSALDLAIINAINSSVSSQVSGGTLNPAHLTAGALIALTNGDFTTAANWNREGATNILNGTATLTEQSQKLASLTQAFTIPTGAKRLQFTIVDNHLVRDGETGRLGDGGNKAPDDAFEVALLDTTTFNPLAGTIGLSHSDSLLNIQANGTTFKSDKVTIVPIGNNSKVVTIDISNITPDTNATLYFNLLGFGAKTSTITIDDVKLFTSTQPLPIAKNDTLTTNQATPLTFTPTTNDTNITTIQIITQPTNGTLTTTPTGEYTYKPNSSYVGTDSFTYIGFDADGQVSNLATVNITVNNLPPTIQSIDIPTNIKEGAITTLSATATDAGNDPLTYRWYINGATTPIEGRSIDYTW